MKTWSRPSYTVGLKAVGRTFLALGLVAGTAAWPSPVLAQTFRLHGEAGGARAVGGAQRTETGWGGMAAAGVEVELVPAVGIQAMLTSINLSAGDPPQDPTLKERGSSSGLTLTGGLRFRPFISRYNGRPSSVAGFWVDVNGGPVRTGSITRVGLDAHVGYDLIYPNWAVGPYVGYVQVFQPNDTLVPDDANIVVGGLHVMWGKTVHPVSVLDYDGDGIPDSRDQCPRDPEDRDGFQDEDGCPDPDNDKDGVMDVEDACPMVKGVRTSNPKTNGCPPKDRDRDGIPDDIDKCPDEPEDKDGFQDEDGCPDPDNDKDGFLDAQDKCPNEPETVNGYADDDGCPDSEDVRVVGDKILLDDRVHFETNKAAVLPQSFALLKRVAKLLISNPEYITVQVEGYADERGTEEYNKTLSAARATSVLELLVKSGMSRERLSAVGFGTSNPRNTGRDESAWRENRRVEFRITRETKVIERSGGPEEKQ